MRDHGVAGLTSSIWRFVQIRFVTLAAVFLIATLLTVQPHGEIRGNRYFPFYNFQAQSYLQGRLDIDVPQGFWDQDMIEAGGKHYLAIGALNGLLFVPFVKYAGTDFSERVFTLLFFGLYLFIIHRFVTRHIRAKTACEYALWIVALALGTEILSCAVISTAWFSAELSSSVLLAAAALVQLESGELLRRQTLAVALLCVAALGRFHLFLLVPIFLGASLVQQRRLRNFFILAVPPSIFLILIGAWNWARFGNPFSLNYGLHHYAGYFQDVVSQHGFTNWRYIFPHLYHGFFGMPKLTTEFPFFEFDDAGNGIFALSPFLLFAVFRRGHYRAQDFFALISILVVCVPIFMHFSVGWRQFGYRYSLDFLPFLVFLLSRSRFSIKSPLAVSLIGVSLWFHVWGLLRFVQ
jgi:hypothetical protein